MAKPARVAEVRSEHLLTELLTAQGWDIRRPPVGELLRQQEYKDHSHLLDAFRGRSKKGGGGDALPEAVLVERSTLQPIAIIEVKATIEDLDIAIREVTEEYGRACIDAGYSPLAIAIAGTSEDSFAVRVFKWNGRKWQEATYEGNPINWIPNRADADNLRASSTSSELRPTIPPVEVLAARAEEINRLLRESRIKDEFRPAVVAAIMLALWRSKGSIRKDPEYILEDINAECKKAFWQAKKADLSGSLRIDDANDLLKIKARRIVSILERLNITVLTAEHDYLGQLYETFFRYTGGNTIGQFFTPRHVTAFMADLCEIGPSDVVLDPACGTGGFLISAMNRMQRCGRLSRSQVVKLVGHQLVGFDSEPQTAALCVTNMILRGDGSTGVKKDDCFSSRDFPSDQATVVLMNPPFPHKATDRPSTDFIDRGLVGLKRRGLLGTIVPYSLLVNTGNWHRGCLAKNTLLGVFTLPPDLFNPYARFDTAILVLQKGIPHSSKAVFFGRVGNDGFKLKKNNRVSRDGSQLPDLLKAFTARTAIPGLSAVAEVSETSREWSPEAYIQSVALSDRDFVNGFEESVRLQAAFYVQFGYRLLGGENDRRLRSIPSTRVFAGVSLIDLGNLDVGEMLVQDYFNVQLGGKDEIEDLDEGDTPLVSTSEFANGVTAWKQPKMIFNAPVITSATDGSVCSSFVQEMPFYAFYKVAVLSPKNRVPVDALYFVAYLLKRERWRYVYARKFGKARILQTKLLVPFRKGKPDFDMMAELTRKTVAFPIIAAFREVAEASHAHADMIDAGKAKERIGEIQKHPERLVSGAELKAKLDKLLS